MQVAAEEESASTRDKPTSLLEQVLIQAGLSGKPEQSILMMDGQILGSGRATLKGLRFIEGDGAPNELNLDQLAAVAGGGGMGRRHRLFYLDGSVSVGTLEWERATFEGEALSKVILEPGTLDLLALPSKEPVTLPTGTLCVAWSDGSEQAIAANPAHTIELQGLWGTVKLPLSQVEELAVRSAQEPGAWVSDDQGSRLSVWRAGLHLDDPEPRPGRTLVAIARSFGELQIALNRLGGALQPDADGPRVELIDGSVILGPPAEAELAINELGTTLASPEIAEVARLTPVHPPAFAVTPTTAASPLSSRPVQPSLQTHFAGVAMDLPWHQIEKVVWNVVKTPDPTEDETPKDASAP